MKEVVAVLSAVAALALLSAGLLGPEEERDSRFLLALVNLVNFWGLIG